jgi:hypothetical protein
MISRSAFLFYFPFDRKENVTLRRTYTYWKRVTQSTTQQRSKALDDKNRLLFLVSPPPNPKPKEVDSVHELGS